MAAARASQVAFLSWEFGNESLTIARVPAPPQLSNALTQSVYLPGSHRVGTASRHGKVVLWGDDARGRKTLLKVVTVCKSPVAVATLLPDGDFVALAGEDGVVRFFDGDLRLIGWNDSLDAGPINSMSFSADSSHKGLGDNTLLGRTMAPGDLSRVVRPFAGLRALGLGGVPAPAARCTARGEPPRSARPAAIAAAAHAWHNAATRASLFAGGSRGLVRWRYRGNSRSAGCFPGPRRCSSQTTL